MDGQALIESAEQFGLDTSLLKPIILDVTNTEHIDAAVQRVSDFVGDRGLKGLFNNAGVSLEVTKVEDYTSVSVEYIDMEFYRKTFEVNFFGLVQVTKAFLPLLRKAKDSRIIMNTSVAGLIAGPFISAYGSSKFAVEAFSDSLRREVATLGVSVSILEPGYIMTPIFSAKNPKSQEPYVVAEQTARKNFWKGSVDASSPRVTSQAVVDAMRSERPKIRYCVGKDATLIWLISKLPAHWVDAMARNTPDMGVTEEELRGIAAATRTEFEL